MKMESMYEQLGVSAAVYEYGERIIAELRDRFDAIDQTAEYNQAKVLSAMQKNRVNATHFAATTGYGYDDEGRDNLERVYADVFHTEAALVRPQITCGTHALTVALSANLLPGDELLSCGHAGKPRVGVVDRVLHQQAHGAVDEAGGELIGKVSAKQLRRNEQIQHIEQNGLRIEKGYFYCE